MKRNHEIGSFEKLGKTFEIHVDVKIKSWDKTRTAWESIFRFTEAENMEDCCRMGMRIPAVKTRVGTNDSLHIAHGVNFYGNYFGDISGIPTNEWFHLGLAQFKSKVV